MKGDISGGQKALQTRTREGRAQRRRTARSSSTRTARRSSRRVLPAALPKDGKLASRPSATSRTSTRRSVARSRTKTPASGRAPSRVHEAEPAVDGKTQSSEGHPARARVPRSSISSSRAEPILRLRGIGRRFGGLHAVRDVDLDVAHGERRAILGPNGAGKTTLFNVISGDIAPTSGTIEFLGRGRDARCRRARARSSGCRRTYQKSRLFLGLYGRGQPLPRRRSASRGGHLRPVVLPRRDGELRERRARSRRRSGSAPSSTALVGSLSHGEQRQLEVGMARAGEPEADDARRAGLGPLPRRAGRADGSAARSSTRRSR